MIGLATILFSSSSLFALVVDAGLWKLRDKRFSNWTVVACIDDHEGWPPIQPWDEWKNFTVQVPGDAVAMQITSADANGKIPKINGVFCANMPFYGVVDFYTFIASAISWGPAMNISVGFLFED